jgi:TP901 family phage tail tape measure protein
MANNQLKVTLLGDASKLNATLKTASGRLKSFGKSTTAVGKSLQTRLALPLALAGGAAIKMATDFDKSMTKVKSLVGIAGDEVDRMGATAKTMAKEFGVSSSKAAEALFFITSAGLRGDEAMQTLEASLKASAVGLGETATIADLATSAMNAYGSDTLGAANATDVLTAAVREGKLSSEDLAGAMGAVLPMASNMGVQFHEVGAAFAAMSRTGTNASEAATQLNAIMLGIMKPTKTAADNMELLGLSSAGLRQQIKDEGLLSVMNTLRDASEQNAGAFELAFGSVRALRGVLDLTGKSMDSTRTIFENMNNTAGMTQTAFDETAQSAEFRLRKAMNSSKESFAQLGATLLTGFLPIFQQVSTVIQKVFKAFFDLDEGTQKLILGLGAFAIVLPTIITLIGTLTTLMGALLSPVGLVAAAIAGVAFIIYKNWSEVLPVVVGLYNQFVDLYNGSEALRKVIYFLKAAFQTVFTFAKTQVMLVINSFSTMWKLIKEFSEKGFKGSFKQILSDGFDESIDIVKSAGEEIGDNFTDAMSDAVGSTLEKKTVEQVQGALTNVKDQVSGFVTGLIGDVGGGTGTAPAKGTSGGGGATTMQPTHGFIGATGVPESGGGGGGATTMQPSHGFIGDLTLPDPDPEIEKVNRISDALSNMGMSMEQIKETADLVGGSVANAFDNMSQGLVNSLGLAKNGFEGFIGGMISTVLQLISMMLSQSIAQAIAGATASGASTGPAAVFTTPAFIATAVGGVMSAFAAIPKFADGGIVSGTTLGVMGEYTGAKQNPEVIAPLNKLEAMIGGKQTQQVNVGGEFRIQGQDLVVALQRAERNRSRLK